MTHPATPDAALEALIEGNRRHREDRRELRDHSPVAADRRREEQRPFAAIISCSDSRVSPTLIFDVERGNVFVSKVAGNSIGTGTLGSTEYAVEILGVKLVMVLGHSDCGAVRAAIEVANGDAGYPRDRYGEIGAVVQRVVPPVRALAEKERSLERSVAANASAQAADIAARRPIIEPAASSGKIKVVAAVYDIASGGVSLL